MTRKSKAKLSRRGFVSAGGALALGSMVPPSSLLAQTDASGKRRYLFVICASGGASIIDSFLAQTEGPAAYPNLVRPPASAFSAAPALANTLQGGLPLGVNYSQSEFVTKYGSDMCVMTCDVSSVNHAVAARRAMTGDSIFGGRTIAEAIAAKYGMAQPLANLLLTGGGYAAPGDDGTVPEAARGQLITDPLMFAFSTHGSRGITSTLSGAELDKIRELRGSLEKISRFTTTHNDSRLLGRYVENRERVVKMLEKGDTITRLMLVDANDPALSGFGLTSSPDFDLVRGKFANLATDPFESRLALAFLATKNNLSSAVSVGLPQSPQITAAGTPNAPIAFDWSHVDHRGAQNAMWSYVLRGVGGLIDLLKATDIDNDPAKGKMWEQSLIYIATEFGRDKLITGGSGHNVNNGVVFISPLLAGNRVFGGVDQTTGLTYGFDRMTGDPAPGVKMKEADIYSVIATAFDLEFERRTDVKVMMRG